MRCFDFDECKNTRPKCFGTDGDGHCFKPKESEKAPAHEIPEYIMIKLRRREDLDDNDKSRDKKFRALDPEAIFDEVVSWELGNGGWGNTLLNWARDCGIKIEGRE
jgi:hypothetical protein